MQTVFDFTVPGSAVSYRRSTGAGFVDAAALQDAPRLHTPQMAANWQPMWWYGGWCAGFAAGPRGVAASPAPCLPAADLAGRELPVWFRADLPGEGTYQGLCGTPPPDVAGHPDRRPGAGTALPARCDAACAGRRDTARPQCGGRSGRDGGRPAGGVPAARCDAAGVPDGGLHRHRPVRGPALCPRLQLCGLGPDARPVPAGGLVRFQPCPLRPDDREFYRGRPLGHCRTAAAGGGLLPAAVRPQ